MKRFAFLISGLTLLAACGADGEPVQPTADTNLYITSSGVSVATNVAVGHGPFRVNLGLGL